MRYNGVIIKVENTLVTVRLQVHAEVCSGCSSCSLHKKPCNQGLDIVVPAKPGEYREGELIEAETELPHKGLTACIVLGAPLAGMLLGGLIGYRSAPGNDGYVLTGCVLGLVCGFIFAAFAERKLPWMKPRIGVITKTQAPGSESNRNGL